MSVRLSKVPDSQWQPAEFPLGHWLRETRERTDEIGFIDKPPMTTQVMPMLITTKVRKIGNSLGIVLPKDALQALRVEEGATLYLTESPTSSLTITPECPGFDVAMRVAAEGMNRYRNALRELAK